MKASRGLLVALSVYCCNSAFAGIEIYKSDDSFAEIFSTLDVAYGTVSNSLPANQYSPTSIMPWVTSGIKSYGGAADRQTDFFNGGLSTSNVGVQGHTKINNEFSGIFKLDSAINPISMELTDQAHAEAMNGGLRTPTTAYATSSLNGETFAREAYFGVSSEHYGVVTVGRNNNFILDVMNANAPLGKANLLTPFGNGVLGGGGGISENARLENSIKYTDKQGRYNYGVEYTSGNGGGTVLGLGNSGKYGGRGWALNAGYDDSTFATQFVLESFQNLLKTAPAAAGSSANNPLNYNAIALTAYDQKAALLAFKYRPNADLNFQAGLEKIKLSAASENVGSITKIYDETVASVVSYNGTEQSITVKYIGADYKLTPSWNLGFSYSLVNMPSWSGFTNSSTSSFSGGDQHSNTVLLVNHFNEKTDIYLGVMNTRYSGAAFAGNTYITTDVVQAIGMRYKF